MYLIYTKTKILKRIQQKNKIRIIPLEIDLWIVFIIHKQNLKCKRKMKNECVCEYEWEIKTKNQKQTKSC